MILIDQKPFDLAEALNDKNAKFHNFAKVYNDTMSEFREKFPNKYIRFKRKNAVKYVKGADARGTEIPKMAEPVTPWRIPLSAYVALDNTGKHTFMCCLDTPKVLPNGLWDMGKERGITIKEDKLVNYEDQPDLAFFLYKITRFVQKKLIAVVDPKADDETLGQEERELTERKYAVWNMISDPEKLKMMARAYGLNNVESKQPNAIRKELEALLVINDKLKRQNPAVKGTKEFIEEMKVTDGVLLRAFVQKSIDEKKLTWHGDGRWKIGQKIIVQVPITELQRKNDFLCNYLMAGNNSDKLKEFMVDLLDKDYLNTITDKKEWTWLAKIAEVPYVGKKPEEIKQNTITAFCPI